METKERKIFDKKSFLLTLTICLFVGMIGAFVVARESSGYVASFTFLGVLILVVLPLCLILLLCFILLVYLNNPKLGLLFLLSSFLIPLFFFISLKFMEVTKIAVYKQDGVDEIKPMEFEAAKGWTIVFQKGLSYEQRKKFTNDNFFPWKPDIGFTHESGVCQLSGQNLKDYEAVTIYFCSNVTEEQKEKLRVKLKESEIVLKYYENKRLDELKDLP